MRFVHGCQTYVSYVVFARTNYKGFVGLLPGGLVDKLRDDGNLAVAGGLGNVKRLVVADFSKSSRVRLPPSIEVMPACPKGRTSGCRRSLDGGT